MAIIAEGQEFGDGGDAAFQVAGQEEESHDDKGHGREDLPRHDGKAIGVGGAVEADQLLGGEVGEHEGPGDEAAGEAPPREEVAIGGAVVVLPRHAPGNKAHKAREKDKGNDGNGLHGDSSGMLNGGKTMALTAQVTLARSEGECKEAAGVTTETTGPGRWNSTRVTVSRVGDLLCCLSQGWLCPPSYKKLDSFVDVISHLYHHKTHLLLVNGT